MTKNQTYEIVIDKNKNEVLIYLEDKKMAEVVLPAIQFAYTKIYNTYKDEFDKVDAEKLVHINVITNPEEPDCMMSIKYHQVLNPFIEMIEETFLPKGLALIKEFETEIKNKKGNGDKMRELNLEDVLKMMTGFLEGETTEEQKWFDENIDERMKAVGDIIEDELAELFETPGYTEYDVEELVKYMEELDEELTDDYLEDEYYQPDIEITIDTEKEYEYTKDHKLIKEKSKTINITLSDDIKDLIAYQIAQQSKKDYHHKKEHCHHKHNVENKCEHQKDYLYDHIDEKIEDAYKLGQELMKEQEKQTQKENLVKNTPIDLSDLMDIAQDLMNQMF